MSMLSTQIDRLRSHADLYDGTTKPEMAKELQRPYLAQELRDAADIIWELRDDLQRANAENAKLREQVSSLVGRSFRTADKMSCIEADNAKLRESAKRLMAQRDERLARAEAENAKLREVIDDITEVVEVSDPALVRFIAKRMSRMGVDG